jgi:glyoxylase-like metal-dependent hydrolase (beta-lactamase superfamily II)
MRIHHLNCGTMCPFGGRLMDGFSAGIGPATLVCHCLLIEAEQGLVLVDTGLGMGDVARPDRLSRVFRAILRPAFRETETALQQIQRLGFSPTDVRHIVLTHLDFDHAGGILDFPNAQVHLHSHEHRAGLGRRSFTARRRYCPMQWTNGVAWKEYDTFGERWFGFEAVRQLDGLPPEILIVPLIGHTWGHSGVAVRSDAGWLLHAGDAYFFREEISPEARHCTPGLAAYQKMMEVDRSARLANQERLRDLVAKHPEVRVFSAHDAVELENLQQRAAESAGTVEILDHFHQKRGEHEVVR